MTTTTQKTQPVQRVIAIDLMSRGFGYVIFEGPERFLDWGYKEVRGNKHVRCLAQLDQFLAIYEPDYLIIENIDTPGLRRSARVKRLLSAIERLALRRKVRIRKLSRRLVLSTFSQEGAVTKDEIAAVLAEKYSDLAPWLPPPRKTWMPESDGMSVFDATALAHTFFHTGTSSRPTHLHTTRNTA